MAQRVDGHCSWCRVRMPVPDRTQGGGRSKKFCSAACKQAEYRRRRDDGRSDTRADNSGDGRSDGRDDSGWFPTHVITAGQRPVRGA